jgi:AraC-like DNA-binding protein
VKDARAIIRLDRLLHVNEQTYRYLVDEWLGSWRNWLGSTGILFEEVRLTTTRPNHVRTYERILGCDIFYLQAADEIHFSRKALDCRLDTANDLVNSIIAQHCEERLSSIEQKEILVERVKREVEALAYHRVDSDRIADRLRISARTVRRNLANSGTSFHDVVMEQRMGLAERYLKDPSVPIKQISSSLGYSDTSSFHRAFRLHTGFTPGQFRNQQQRLRYAAPDLDDGGSADSSRSDVN